MRSTSQIRRFDVSLFCLLPLVLLYIVGVFMLHSAPPNGADFITPLLWRFGGRTGLLIFAAILGVTAVILCWRLRKNNVTLSLFVGVVSEGAIAAGCMAFILGVLIRYMKPAAIGSPFAGYIAVSAGAGFWEELLFRAAIFWGFYKLVLAQANSKPAWKTFAIITAAVVSSSLFSVAHFLAETPTMDAFLYRAAAGMLLAALFMWRGLGVCGWAHFFFDMLVFSFSPASAAT